MKTPISQWFKREQPPAVEDTARIPAHQTATPASPDLAELGDRVKDPITGFTGIVTVTAQFLHGCTRCGVLSETLKDGLPQLEQHFDQAQLTVVDKGIFTPATVRVIQTAARRPAEERAPGGPPRAGDALQQASLPAPADSSRVTVQSV
jgi:hypothetical protein